MKRRDLRYLYIVAFLTCFIVGVFDIGGAYYLSSFLLFGFALYFDFNGYKEDDGKGLSTSDRLIISNYKLMQKSEKKFMLVDGKFISRKIFMKMNNLTNIVTDLNDIKNIGIVENEKTEKKDDGFFNSRKGLSYEIEIYKYIETVKEHSNYKKFSISQNGLVKGVNDRKIDLIVELDYYSKKENKHKVVAIQCKNWKVNSDFKVPIKDVYWFAQHSIELGHGHFVELLYIVNSFDCFEDINFLRKKFTNIHFLEIPSYQHFLDDRDGCMKKLSDSINFYKNSNHFFIKLLLDSVLFLNK